MPNSFEDYQALLEANAGSVNKDISKVLNRGAINIRRDWVGDAQRHNPRHARLYPGTIVIRWARASDRTPEAVIEPSKGKQAKLGTILEYGTPTSAPQLSRVRARDKEAPKLKAHLVAAIMKALQ